MRTPVILSCIVLLSFLAPLTARSQEPQAPRSVFTFLTGEEGGKIHLALDLEALLNNRRNAGYLPATLTDVNGQVFKLEVRTRGKFRRRKCEIPPIKLKFSISELQTHQLDTLNEIKLVLPCLNDPASNDLIVREYVAYRMFENLTPFSARARLVRLDLKNHRTKRPQKMFALLVEHEEEIAARLRSLPVLEWGIPPDRYQMEQVALLTLFEYMIGNTDWDLDAARNVLFLQPAGVEKLYAVPFDFDFSGLVNAPYATPSSPSGLRRVTDRCLMAKGIDQEALHKARAAMLEAKSSLMDWCKSKQLSADASREMTAFLDVFFKALAENAEIPARLELSKK